MTYILTHKKTQHMKAPLQGHVLTVAYLAYSSAFASAECAHFAAIEEYLK